MIVVDTNIIVYFLIRGKRTEAAHEVWKKDPQWVVPALWRSEFMNVLVMYVEHGGLSKSSCMKLFHDAVDLFLHQEAAAPLLDVLSTALSAHITAYDSYYISLARFLDLPLITQDSELLKKFPSVAFTMKNYVERF